MSPRCVQGFEIEKDSQGDYSSFRERVLYYETRTVSVGLPINVEKRIREITGQFGIRECNRRSLSTVIEIRRYVEYERINTDACT